MAAMSSPEPTPCEEITVLRGRRRGRSGAEEIGVLMMVLGRYRINQFIGAARHNLSKTRTRFGGRAGAVPSQVPCHLAAARRRLARPSSNAYAWASRSRPEMPSDWANALNSLAGISLTTCCGIGVDFLNHPVTRR